MDSDAANQLELGSRKTLKGRAVSERSSEGSPDTR